jgi:hypothetical protein
MADGLTGRVLDSSRTAPRPTLTSRTEPAAAQVAARPSLLSMVALAVVAAVIGRRRARTSAAPASTARVVRKQKKVMAVYLAAGVVILAAWRPVLSAYRDHRYSARWSRQPLGW